jgi:hypothetical protein
MDNQIPSPNMPSPQEIPGGLKPENLQAGPPAAETAPTPGGGAPPPAATPTTPPPKLTADQVAAAIAATPGPGAKPATAPLPGVAGDVDVIEPEWVDKAEEVVKAHHGDPYGEEEAIEELQEDYLQKRYGIKVADPNGDNKPKGP